MNYVSLEILIEMCFKVDDIFPLLEMSGQVNGFVVTIPL